MFWDSLTDQQREGARLASRGARPSEVARTLGVTPSTVSNWRRKGDYRRYVILLQRAADERSIEDARAARAEAIRLGLDAIKKGFDGLDNFDDDGRLLPGADPHKASAVSKILLDWYKTLSAQTGLTETTRVESVGDEAEALEQVLKRLDERGE